MSFKSDLIASKKTLYAQYLAAEQVILKKQSYTLGQRTLTHADLKDVQKERRQLEKEIIALETGGGNLRIQRVVVR